MSFAFGRSAPNGALVWYSSWTGESALPRYVRLIVRDRGTSADLLGEADFVVRADAPPACGRTAADLACLSVAPTLPTDLSGPERSTQ
jgi:hypothetical protein